MRTGRYLFILLFFFLNSSLQAQTSFDSLLVQADSGERDLKNRSMELKGNVQIIFKGQHLSADKATIYQDRKEFEAEGHVLLVTPKATLGGDKIRMNYETSQGTVYTGFIQAGQVIFEGAIIERKGEDQYATTQSHYTSCTTCPAAWSFSGQSIDAKIGGYAFIKNSLLNVGTVPVLWLPYLVVPLKSDRQTGLLTPSVESSKKGGVSISQPFFWAISPSQDATFTLQTYATRGLKTLANYRYILNRDSYGELDTAFIRDSYFGHTRRYTTYLSEAERVNRWFLRYRHYWVLPNDWIQRASINNASDLQYPNDFQFETFNLGDPAMETRMSLTKNSEDLHFSIDNSYYINLIKGHPMGSNRDSVHRLPEITLASTRKTIGETGFLYNYELRYTNFARNDFAYDDLTVGPDKDGKPIRQVSYKCANGNTSGDPKWEYDPSCTQTRDGEFNVGHDLIRSGQRLIMEPTISRPVQLGHYFNLTPKLSYRESHYSFGIQDISDLTRRFLRSEVKLQTSFSRIFGDQNDPRAIRYKHEIQPEIISTAVPWLDQPHNHPFLGFTAQSEVPFYSREAASDADLFGDHGIQFDYDDRLYDRNLITYRMTNKIMKKSWTTDKIASYDRLLTWRLSQTYDVYEARRGPNRQPWSDVESILSVRLANFNTYAKINFLPYQKLSNTSAHMTFNDDSGNYLKLGLTRNYSTGNNGTIDVTQRVEDYLVQIGTTTKYLNFAGRLIYNNNDFLAKKDGRVKAFTYAMIFRPPGNCWNISYIHHFATSTKDIIDKINFEFLFDGKPSGESPTKTLETYGF